MKGVFSDSYIPVWCLSNDAHNQRDTAAETSHVHVVYQVKFDWLLFFLMPRLNKHLTGCLFLHDPNNPSGVGTKSFFPDEYKTLVQQS